MPRKHEKLLMDHARWTAEKKRFKRLGEDEQAKCIMYNDERRSGYAPR